MYQRILVPLDGSTRAEHAIPVAIRLAHASGGTVVFALIVQPHSEIGDFGTEVEPMVVPPDDFEKRLTRGEAYLQHITQTYTQKVADVRVEQEVDTGATPDTIFSIARLEKIDLIVMCSHGAHALYHWTFNSVARAAVHRSPVPVLVLREKGGLYLDTPQTRPLRFLVPLDGSPQAEAVCQPALQLLTALAMPGEAEMHLVQVVDLPSVEGKPLLQAYKLKEEQEEIMQKAEDYLKLTAKHLSATMPRDTRPIITWSLLINKHVARSLISMVNHPEGSKQKGWYDLLAMAAHGRNGLQLLKMSSITEHILSATDLPLLVVHPPAIPQQSDISARNEEKMGAH